MGLTTSARMVATDAYLVNWGVTHWNKWTRNVHDKGFTTALEAVAPITQHFTPLAQGCQILLGAVNATQGCQVLVGPGKATVKHIHRLVLEPRSQHKVHLVWT